MTTKVPIKSILKQPAPDPSEAEAKSARDQQNYNLALQHAHRIQSQKDWQTRILNAIQVLLDYPTPTSPHHNESEDPTKFLLLIQPFQPSDLDALIEERVVDGKCGWPLCSQQPRVLVLGRDAEWKVGKFKSSFCSNVCAKSMAFVKTQVSEVPVWERNPDVTISISLPDGFEPAKAGAESGVSGRTADDDVANGIQDLALERGEKVTSFRPKQVMVQQIVEKVNVEHRPLSGVHSAAVSSTAIEGYEPRVKKTEVGFVDDEGE